MDDLDERAVRIGLGVVGVAIFGVGCWLLWPLLGWRGIVGGVLVAWAYNINTTLQAHRLRADVEEAQRRLADAEVNQFVEPVVGEVIERIRRANRASSVSPFDA